MVHGDWWMHIQSLPHVLAHREPVRSPGPPQEAVPQVSSETPDIKIVPNSHMKTVTGKKRFFGNPKKDG